MIHTVGIVGVSGNVGAPTAKYLAQAAGEGKIKLVLFHRTNSDTSAFPDGQSVELRVLEFDDSPEKIKEAVKGVNVFISAVGFGALPTEPNLVEGLALSPDLVTYIPSVYSTTWTEEDFKHPQLGQVISFLHTGWEKAEDKKIGVTPVFTGVFDLYWFAYGFLGSPLKENTIWANEKQMKNKVPITTLDHLGAALARIASTDPQSIKNREYSVVSFWPTGNELKDLYTKINGKEAQVKDVTQADYEAQMADGANFGPAKAGYWQKWQDNSYGYEADGRTSDKAYSGPCLEDVARVFAKV
ncbi:hypothetical protein LTR56_012990 [Elasticomyces elasticus]|nr:hypothetical protein LTR56_012990 [Elasticomyces elasticus]KAK3649274.1 hypothetical protein LTR22_013003 [Elasticomyces elasticus]KAK4928192.1 hypothetical protein LTR49_005130 [Elasticomyces elasticus]KAK5765946.1 hypothetical protein LTS12_003953 [Elasticomyces elasticus]